MKQTAVGYIDSLLIELIKKFNSKEYKVACNTLTNFRNVCIQQAKAMEKEQIESAYRKGYTESSWGRHSNSEQYYNETFKSE